MESTTTSLQAVPRDPMITMATARDGESTTVASAVQEIVPAETRSVKLSHAQLRSKQAFTQHN